MNEHAKREGCAEAVSVSVHQQVCRMLASMKEFPFEPGGAWRVPVGGDGFEEGFTRRRGGDPIFHTLSQIAGVRATRAQVIEAVTAVAERRHPQLPPRLATLPLAIKLVAKALADGKRVVRTEEGVSVRIQGPILPPDSAVEGRRVVSPDYRDLVIAALADQEAALIEALVETCADRDAYREVAHQAIHALHEQHIAHQHLREQHKRLTDEYRRLREHILRSAEQECA